MILLSLFLSLFAFILNVWVFPEVHLLVFAPFCILMIQSKSKATALWAAAFVGLFYDLFSGSAPFGLLSLCYALSALFAFSIKGHLPLWNLSRLTVAFSMIYTLVHLALFQSFFGIAAFISSFLAMPLIDGLYAFCWHHLPLVLYTRLNETPRHRY